MRKNDLNEPLRRKAQRQSWSPRPIIVPVLISAALLLAMIASIWIAVVEDPDGGRSVAMAPIEAAAPSSTGSLSVAETEAIAEARGPPPEPAAWDVGSELAALPSAPPASTADPGLVEPSPFGPLPRVSPDGRRPREAYARRAPAADPGAPRIVIVVGGMGLSQTGTQRAIETLPEDITLAFAPYGSSLQRWIDKARAEGHEVLLQVPLEPADYPAQNPGEHTLLVSTDSSANRDDLNWVLARATGYTGVMNYMGARFLSEDQAVLPFLGEIGERGLFYLDDGLAPDSVAARIGGALQVPVVTGDLVVDRRRAPEEIERELAALEALARRRGMAVGTASAFPASVNTVANWVREAQARGIVFVPASAALGAAP